MVRKVIPEFTVEAVRITHAKHSGEYCSMKRLFPAVIGFGAILLLGGCTTPWVTNTPRSAIEQYLVASTIEHAIGNLDFSKYSGRKAIFDYDYFAPQVDKQYVQGILEMQVSKFDIIITRRNEEADIIIQPLCGVLGTDYSKFLIGTPEVPIPVPDTSVSFAIPEIPIFSKYTRIAYGRFAFNIFEAKTRKPLEAFSGVNSSASYNNWIVLLIPFSTHTMDMENSHDLNTQVDFFE